MVTMVFAAMVRANRQPLKGAKQCSKCFVLVNLLSVTATLSINNIINNEVKNIAQDGTAMSDRTWT